MLKIRRTVSLILVVLLAICMISIAAAEDNTPYRIAMVGPLTGPGAQYSPR